MACICKCGRVKECGEICCALCECEADNRREDCQKNNQKCGGSGGS
jgi:hypothetical protein